MTLPLLMLPGFLLKSIDALLSVWLSCIASAMLTVFGAFILSRLSHRCNVYGVLATLLSWASGEQISLTQLGCIVLCVIGVILQHSQGQRRRPHNTPRF
ncbi:hypothetical protein [Pseudomonas sp. 24 E 13]|nr:hypothetical protein [Pseudomonas sp. 24 E 13]